MSRKGAPSSTSVSLVTHELQAPLTVLRSRLEAALEKPWCAGDCKALVSQCLEEVREMNQLVVDILLLERVETGGLPLEAGKLNLAELAGAVGQSFEAIAQSKGLSLHMTLETSLPIMGDTAKLRRVLVNLMDNAVKYTPSGGQVQLHGRRVGPNAEIEVMNTGAAIAPEELARIFDPFYQIDKAKSREAGGIGLGLSIARALAEEHSGNLDVESSPDRGSRFLLKIPLAAQNWSDIEPK